MLNRWIFFSFLLEKMTLKTKKIIHILIIFSCIREAFTSVHFFHPPLLNIEDEYINVSEVDRTLDITCVGKYPLSWKTPITRDENRISINITVNSSEAINKYKSTITVQNLDFNDTGFYICFYEGTTDFTSAVDNTTSIYVFINDPIHLFLENSAIISGHLLIPLLQHRKSVIPCLPTSPDVNVTLWKTESEEDVGEMVQTGTDITFDPRQGFHLHYPTIYFNGFFQCRAILKDNYQEINLTLFYMPDTFNDPQPFIDSSGAQHPLVNGTFVLKCVVDAEPDTRLFIEWDYPNKNVSLEYFV
ncbi:vascular endothelial growth factor receptor 1-like [Parasteatoda tepidariorum]|uniref:vascular endothelial growth factor receptor 1-like n=1 Tax=Parasteatoda tepidariorum TaxID=114398 RepID=UPI0039BCF332